MTTILKHWRSGCRKWGNMKTFTIEDIRSWKPCYDPNKYLPYDWSGTSIDILNKDIIPFQDRLWVVLRKELVSETTARLFAVWCYGRDISNELLSAWEFATWAAKLAAKPSKREESWSATESTRLSARSSTRSKALSAQKEKLIEMIIEENK